MIGRKALRDDPQIRESVFQMFRRVPTPGKMWGAIGEAFILHTDSSGELDEIVHELIAQGDKKARTRVLEALLERHKRGNSLAGLARASILKCVASTDEQEKAMAWEIMAKEFADQGGNPGERERPGEKTRREAI